MHFKFLKYEIRYQNTTLEELDELEWIGIEQW